MNTRSKRSAGGYATAELAVTLPALIIIVLMAVWILACVNAQLRCVDGARAAARSAARGDPAGQVTEAARVRAPRGAQVVLTTTGTVVRVVVRAEVKPLGALVALLPGTPVSATAVAEREQPGAVAALLPGKLGAVAGLLMAPPRTAAVVPIGPP